jgi:SOS-response transcriptional repressor LexA
MEPKDRLKAAREKAGHKSPSEAARANRTININTITSNENGNRPISKKMALVYADAFNVSAGWLIYGDDTPVSEPSDATRPALKISGEVAAGHWLESDLFEQEKSEMSNVSGGDARYLANTQYLLRVKGESLNRIAQDGDLILCLDYAQAGIDLKSSDLVVIERSRDGGHTLERTAKRVVKHNGDIELRPESDDPRFQDPVIYNEHSEEASEVRVIAKILKVIREIS